MHCAQRCLSKIPIQSSIGVLITWKGIQIKSIGLQINLIGVHIESIEGQVICKTKANMWQVRQHRVQAESTFYYLGWLLIIILKQEICFIY